MAIPFLPEADGIATQIGSASWASSVSAAGGADRCGDDLGGFPGILMDFIYPLVDLHQKAQGDPGALYQGATAWASYAGTTQEVSEIYLQASQALQGQQGLFASVTAGICQRLSDASHSLANWGKVVNQALQVCVRLVEIMRAIICSGYEMLANIGGSVADFLFGSWPWELDKKADVINDFADNAARIIDDVVANVERVLQALRELVRLVLDLYRAIIPFHEELERRAGELIDQFPPGSLLGPLGNIPSVIPTGSTGDVYNPGPTPFPGSDQRFLRNNDLGYAHQYDLGSTDMTTEELNEMLRQNFGTIFPPSQVGDNSQLNMQLTGTGQIIETSLFGVTIPGNTGGNIVVQQVTDDGFVVAAKEGHPEYPGEVAFRIRNVNGSAILEVSGAYNQTILDKMQFGGNTNPAFAAITDNMVWSDLSYRLQDAMNYG